MKDFDITNTIHAAAFIIAAGHFLCNVPELPAEEIYNLLNRDEETATAAELSERNIITVWAGVTRTCGGGDPYLCALDLIENLALNMVEFAEQVAAKEIV